MREENVIDDDIIAKIFPGNKNALKYYGDVLDALAEYELDDCYMVAVAFGTISAETQFSPIGEYISKYNTEPGGRPYGKYDFRADIGNGAVGDGERYKGRGFVQLTGKYNYQRYGELLGIDLVNNPEKANDPVIASKILALFLKEREDQIRDAIEHDDLKKIRRLVNGGSHGLETFIKTYKLSEKILC